MPVLRLSRVQTRVRAQLRDCREVEAREVRGLRTLVQHNAGGRIGLRRQRRVLATEPAAVACAARRADGTDQYADRHEALQRHHRRAGEQAANALERVRVLRSEGDEEDVGPGVP